jgi:hypothetical protein
MDLHYSIGEARQEAMNWLGKQTPSSPVQNQRESKEAIG